MIFDPILSLTGIKLGSALQSSGLSQAQARLVLGGVNTALGSAVTSAVNGAAPDLRVMAAQYVGSQAGQTAVDVAADQIDHLTHGINQTSKPRDLSQANQRESQTRSSARNQQTANRQLDRKLETREADAHDGDMRSQARRTADREFIHQMEEPIKIPDVNVNLNVPRRYVGDLMRGETLMEPSSVSSVANNRSSFWNNLNAFANSKTIGKINSMGEGIAGLALHPINAAKGIASFISNPMPALESAVTSVSDDWHALTGSASSWSERVDALGSLLLDVPAAVSGVGAAVRGASAVGRLGLFNGSAGSFGRGAVAQLGLLGEREAVVQQAIFKHPLAGLSPENVIRLADEIGLGTPRDQLILWSGLGRGNAGVRLSQEYAAVNGGITLEMTSGGRWLEKMDLYATNSPFTRAEVGEIWEKVSTRMIQQASGQVRSVVGQVKPDSIYRAEQAEMLMNNRLTGLDELNLKPRFIFGR